MKEVLVKKEETEVYSLYLHSSGLRIVHFKEESNISYAGYSVRVGAAQDPRNYFGMAHLVEHMMFKGTQKRSARSIIRRVEEVGADINAFTTKVDTFVYATFKEEFLQRMLHLLTDVVLCSKIPADELEKEKTVILEEINSYKDSPSEEIFDEFEDLLFSGTCLGHNILGTDTSVKRISSEAAQDFMKKYYVPHNMVLVLRGKVDMDFVSHFCNYNFAKYNSVYSFTKESQLFFNRTIKKKRVVRRKDTCQTHCLIGGYAYSMYHKDRFVLSLLNNILGGPGMSSRLNMSLRENSGYVYSVESHYVAYDKYGFFSIYFGSAHKDREAAIRLIFEELQRLREEALSERELLVAKRQFMGQLAISEDNRENTFLALGKSVLFFDKFASQEKVAHKIESISAEDLQRVARDLYQEENMLTLIYK